MGCKSLDEQVARRDPQIADLLDRFVCVRVVQGWGIDLSLFQFDGDLTWAIFFLNADRTIYGRYGTRSGRNAANDVTVEGFKKAVEGALELHKNFPANRKELAGKTGAAPRWKTPETIPLLTGKAVKADGSRGNCIHCHDIHAGELLSLRRDKQAVPDSLLWPYPLPNVLGLTLDPKERATIKTVTAGSTADKAGFKTGDQVLRLEGQPILSIADVQWVLHSAPEPGQVKAELKRGEQTVSLTLPLEQGWRRPSDFLWRTTAWPLRFQLAGLKLGPVPPTTRQNLKLGDDVLALQIDELAPGFVQKRNPSPAQVGLRKGDIIVAVNGKTAPMTERDFLAHLVQQVKPGDKIKLTVLRGGERKDYEVTIP